MLYDPFMLFHDHYYLLCSNLYPHGHNVYIMSCFINYILIRNAASQIIIQCCMAFFMN